MKNWFCTTVTTVEVHNGNDCFLNMFTKIHTFQDLRLVDIMLFTYNTCPPSPNATNQDSNDRHSSL